jgi:EAL domain-containing protein (putative c-di-GMP-specific phosphodiesterase class I)
MTAAPPGPSAAKTAISVLVVDDEVAITRMLARTLGGAGHKVTTAHDGGEAVALVESTTFDVIVSDIRMPGMDGLTLLRAVRGRDLDVPVVFMTGNPALESAVEAIEYGAFRYLVKPFAAQELIELVERAARWHRLALIRREAAKEVPGHLISDRAGLEGRFALGLEKMWMAMQPVLSWQKRSVFAYEALLRTDEPALRNPAEFVNAAERLNRTDELGRAVRKRIAQQLADAPPDVQIFVNLHPSDIVDPELSARDGALTPFAERIVLEVTERAALDQIRGLGAAVAQLRALGFKIALDDLGAGYAGLSSFAQLEPDVVKVDMSLVRGIHAAPLKQKLFRSMAAMCLDLGTIMIAEGVEVAEERDCLTTLGGDLYQGYLFARPGRGFPTPTY